MSKTNEKIVYDAIIIGSGLGGMGAGAFLAGRGKKVLIVEKHNVPGGSASSFIRGRFEFEVALHEMDGFGSSDKPGTIYRFFKEIGIINKIEVVSAPDIYHSVFIEDDFEATMHLMDIIRQHTVHVYENLSEDQQNTPLKALKTQQLNLWNTLPSEFQRKKAVETGVQLGIKERTIGKYLKIFVDQKLATNDEKGYYKSANQNTY